MCGIEQALQSLAASNQNVADLLQVLVARLESIEALLRDLHAHPTPPAPIVTAKGEIVEDGVYVYEGRRFRALPNLQSFCQTLRGDAGVQLARKMWRAIIRDTGCIATNDILDANTQPLQTEDSRRSFGNGDVLLRYWLSEELLMNLAAGHVAETPRMFGPTSQQALREWMGV